MLPRKFPCHYTEEENTFSRPWWRGSVNQLQPANRSVGGWIRCQGTSLACWGRSQQGTFNRRSQFDLVLPQFLSPFPSLKINKIKKKYVSYNLTIYTMRSLQYKNGVDLWLNISLVHITFEASKE